jgi:hypothetical protein
MAQAPVTAKMHQSLDVHRYIPAQVALDLYAPVDIFPDLGDFRFGQIISLGIQINAGFDKNLLRSRSPDAENIG